MLRPRLLKGNMTSQAENRWPDGFMDIGGRTFSWVYENRKDWVDFTRTKMSKPTGLFEQWKNYVLQKSKCPKNLQDVPLDENQQGTTKKWLGKKPD